MVDHDEQDPADSGSESDGGRTPGMSRSDAATWPEFMTAVEVAWVIGLADFRTVHKMIKRGDLVATKLGNQYRIGKTAVMRLLHDAT